MLRQFSIGPRYVVSSRAGAPLGTPWGYPTTGGYRPF